MATAVEPTQRNARAFPRSLALLALSVAFVSLSTVVTHEFGHWVLDRARGAEVRVVAPPFGAPHIEATQPITVDLTGWPDAAGPLANVAAGVLLFATLWHWRRPVLLPLLLWGPVALLQESTTALVQLGTNAPHTDFVRLVAVGVPASAIVAAAVVGFGLGVLGLLAVLPTAGLAASTPPFPYFGYLLVGFGAYPMLGLLLTPWLASASVQRNATLLVFGLVVAALLTGLRGPSRVLGQSFRPPHDASLGASSVWLVFVATTAVHVAMLAIA